MTIPVDVIFNAEVQKPGHNLASNKSSTETVSGN